MGAFPVDLPAFLAHMKFTIVFLRLGLKKLDDLFFSHAAKLPIATQTTGPGKDGLVKIKAI